MSDDLVEVRVIYLEQLIITCRYVPSISMSNISHTNESNTINIIY